MYENSFFSKEKNLGKRGFSLREKNPPYILGVVMKTVFVFGNPLVKEDSIALKTARELGKKIKGIEFREIRALSDLEKIPETLEIIDCAEGIEKITVLEDLKMIEAEKKVSMHDFDLGTELLLMKKIGKIKKVKLVLIPKEYGLEKAVQETRAIF